MIKKLLLGGPPTERSSFIWNMLGSGVYAASSLLLTYLTIRMVGAVDGGMFAIGLTIAQLLANIVYFETRNYQVTDIKKQYDFGDYHSVKIINSVIMIGMGVAYVAIKGYDRTKSVLIVLICIYRMLDGYADGYESHFHTNGRLDLAGKSMTFRALLSVSFYFVVLHMTADVICSVYAAIVAAIAGICIFDVWIFDAVGSVKISFNTNKIGSIIKECFPLFMGIFLWTYILSASRIAVDAVLDDSSQAFFQVLFMPVSVINLFATFILKPSLIGMSEQYANRDSGFNKKTLLLCVEILTFTAFCMIAAYALGPAVLRLISGLDITPYRLMLVFLIFAGGVNALAYLFYSLIMIFRWSKAIMCTYTIASIVALFISSGMTERWGLWGASASYLVSVSLIMIAFGILVLMECRSIKHRK